MAAPPASRGACAFPELPDGLRAPPPPHFHGDQCLGGRLLPVPCAGRCRSPSLSAFEHFHLLCQSPRSSSCWTWNGKKWNPLGMEGAPSLPLAAGQLTSPTCVLPKPFSPGGKPSRSDRGVQRTLWGPVLGVQSAAVSEREFAQHSFLLLYSHRRGAQEIDIPFSQPPTFIPPSDWRS